MDTFNAEMDPELANWLNELKNRVSQKAKEKVSNGGEDKLYLPVINMGRKFRQVESRTYPELQGTISLLPVPYKGQRVVEVRNIIECWCPRDDEWNSGFSYKILPPEYYPEGTVRDRITSIRDRLTKMLNSGKISWKEAKLKKISIMLGYVLSHRNTKGDQIRSALYGKDELIEHKNIPAVVLFPNGAVMDALRDDLETKANPVPYSVACYSNTKLEDRKGWVAIKFTSKTDGGFGYAVKATAEICNPVIMPDGILPKDFNPDDPRVKLLDETDPIYAILDWNQRGTDGSYYNEDSINRLDSFVNYLETK